MGRGKQEMKLFQRFCCRLILKIILIITAVIFVLFILWAKLIYTQSSRLPEPLDRLVVRPASGLVEIPKSILTEQIDKASYTSPSFDFAFSDLKQFPYVKPKLYTDRFDKRRMNTAIGDFRESVQSRDSIYAPAPTDILFDLTLPEHPVMEFEYTVLSSDLQSQAEFCVKIISGEKSSEQCLFSDKMSAVDVGYVQKLSGIKKIIENYIYPSRLYTREKWRKARIDLSAYHNKSVKIEFITSALNRGTVVHAFWANPIIYNLRIRQASDHNIIYVMIDSLNSNMVGCYGSRQNLTPNADNFSKSSIRFNNFCAAGNRTRQAVMPVFTGRNLTRIYAPPSIYVSPEAERCFYQHKVPSLPLLLSEHETTTAMISNNFFLIPNHETGLDVGFSEIHDFSRHHYSTIDIAGEAIEWLSRNVDKKFFMYVHFDSAHPYERPPLKYLWKAFLADRDLRPEYLKYRAQVAYADAYFGRLMTALEKLGLDKNSVVILSADHGKPISRVHCQRLHGRQSVESGSGFYDDEMRVPFLISYPGIDEKDRGRAISSQVSAVDVMPFLLEFCGIKIPAGLNGRSFREVIKGGTGDPTAIDEGEFCRAIRLDNHYKYMRWRSGFERVWHKPNGKLEAGPWTEEFYDLEKDPGEVNNLSGSTLLSLMSSRKLFDEIYKNEPLVDRIVYSGPGELEGQIDAAGKIYVLNEGVRVFQSGDGMKVSMPAGSTLFFEMPPLEKAKYSFKLSRKIFPAQKLLIGRMALPIKSNPGELLPEKDNVLMLTGTGPLPIECPVPWLHWSRMRCSEWLCPPVGAVFESEDIGIQDALKGWGYIQDKKN